MGQLVQAERAWIAPGRIERGWGILIEDGHILDSGPVRRLRQARPPGEAVVDCGRTVLMPGLVNAHVHLELGWMRDLVSARGGFASWVRELRRCQDSEFLRVGADGMRELVLQSIRLGANELLHHGVTAFLDISNTGLVADHLDADGPRAFCALECLGLDRTRASSTLGRAREYMSLGNKGNIHRLVVPHAAYSCSTELLAGLGSVDFQKGHPSIHLLESREERDLFQLGIGALRAMVDEICPDHDLLVGEDPIDRLEHSWNPSPGWIAVHGYCMNASQAQKLSDLGASVCLCPSSRDFFSHPRIPFAEITKAKLTVALGTDSLASAPALSPWREMAQLLLDHPDLDPGKILSWATEGGASALGIPAGRLAPGHWADWIAVDAQDVPDDELEEYLVREEPPVRVVAVGGNLLLDGRWEGDEDE